MKTISTSYSLMISLIEERIEENKDNYNILRRLETLLNDVKALSQIDIEKYDAIKNFADDYD